MEWQKVKTLEQVDVCSLLELTGANEVSAIYYAKKGDYDFYIVVADNGSTFSTHGGEVAVSLIAVNVPEEKWQFSVPQFKKWMSFGKAYLHAIKCIDCKDEERRCVQKWRERVETEF